MPSIDMKQSTEEKVIEELLSFSYIETYIYLRYNKMTIEEMKVLPLDNLENILNGIYSGRYSK